MQKIAKLLKKYNKKTKKKQWALVSMTDEDKVLKWFGDKKPSEDSVAREEKRVRFFKYVKNKVMAKLLKK